MSGCVEFFDAKTLISSAFEDVIQLEKADVIYKKRLKMEEDPKKAAKKAKAKAKVAKAAKRRGDA